MDKTNFDLLSLAFGDRTVLDILKGVTGRNTQSLLCIEQLRETPLTKEEDDIVAMLCEIRRCADFVNQQTMDATEIDECGIYEKWGRILGLIKVNRVLKRDVVYSAFCKCVTAAYKYSTSLGVDALAIVLQSKTAALFAISTHDKLTLQKRIISAMEKTPETEEEADARHEEAIRRAVQEIEEDDDDSEESDRQVSVSREIALRKAMSRLGGKTYQQLQQQPTLSPVASRALAARHQSAIPSAIPLKRPSWAPRSLTEQPTLKQTMHKSALAKKAPLPVPQKKNVTWKNLKPSEDFEMLLDGATKQRSQQSKQKK
jgi:uncharacterized Zn finger protein